MKSVELTWTEDTLDRWWLTSPERLIPETSMTFPGVHERQDRQDVIAYLKEVAAGKAPSSPQRGGMMNMRSAKIDLKKAPPQGQVTAITHCGDIYTVKTADGKINKVWEFNLRFKTDSSDLGPSSGKPVIVGAGMQGDRASIVFASPGEITAFIRTECAKKE